MNMNTTKNRTFSISVWKRILQFYCNSTLKYQLYTLRDGIKDAKLAYYDRVLLDTDKTLKRWEKNEYKVCRNKRGWYFAYEETETDLLFNEAENYRNMTDEAQIPQKESVLSMLKKAGSASHSYLNHDRPFQSVFGDYGPPKLISSYRGFSIIQDQETEMYRIVMKNGTPLLKHSFHSIKWNMDMRRKDILAYGMLNDRKVVIYTNGFAESRLAQRIMENIHSLLRKKLLLIN